MILVGTTSDRKTKPWGSPHDSEVIHAERFR